MRTYTPTDNDVLKDGEYHSVLRDGQVHKVPMMLMDAATVTPAMNRPGSVAITDADRQRRQEQQRKSDTALSERWRAPPTAAVEAVQLQHARTPAPAAADLESAYRRRDQALQQRWKGGVS